MKVSVGSYSDIQRKTDKRLDTKNREGDTYKQPRNLGKDALTSLSGMVAT